MSNIKTITLNGEELKAAGLGGRNTIITNRSSSILYASAFPNIEPNSNNVAAILAGGVMNLYDTNGTVYLLGTGKVQLMGTNYDELPMSALITSGGGGGSSGGGVSQAYVDDADANTLRSAKTYTDTETAKIKTTVSDLSESKVDKVAGKGLSSNDFTVAEKTKLAGLENYDDTELKEEVADIKGYIGYTNSDIYGLEADFENNVFTRLAGAVGKEPGANFDSVRAFGGRRRCTLHDDGTVNAYYPYEDSNYGMDSVNGVRQSVMVEQPKFYYKIVPLKTEKIDGANGYHLRKARYYISDTPKAGFKVHPAFIRNGAEVDKIYLAAYEGSLGRGNGYYLENEQIAAFDSDVLCSIPNALPATGVTQKFTRANARKLAHNRGAGWELSTIQSISATQLLFVIEYATFNSQEAIGDGNIDSSLGVIKTGGTSSLGNASGIASGADNGKYISYRGEENFYGNVWAWCDGCNNLGNKLYVADHDFADDVDTQPFKDTKISLSPTDGYISAFGYSEKYDWLFAASECKGNSAFPIGDYSWNAVSGWHTAILGGCCADGIRAGAFCRHLNYASSYHYWRIGARLTYFPQNTEEVVSE